MHLCVALALPLKPFIIHLVRARSNESALRHDETLNSDKELSVCQPHSIVRSNEVDNRQRGALKPSQWNSLEMFLAFKQSR